MIARKMIQRSARKHCKRGVCPAQHTSGSSDTPVTAGDDDPRWPRRHCAADAALKRIWRESVNFETACLFERTHRRGCGSGSFVDERGDHMG